MSAAMIRRHSDPDIVPASLGSSLRAGVRLVC